MRLNWFEFAQSEWVPENERGFWYPGVEKRLVVHCRAAHSKIRQDFLKSLVVQIYTSSPLITGLLSNANK